MKSTPRVVQREPMATMTISVIIPTFNEESSLPHTLERTFRLGFDEIIVVDAEGKEGTDAVTVAVTPKAAAMPSACRTATAIPPPTFVPGGMNWTVNKAGRPIPRKQPIVQIQPWSKRMKRHQP